MAAEYGWTADLDANVWPSVCAFSVCQRGSAPSNHSKRIKPGKSHFTDQWRYIIAKCKYACVCVRSPLPPKCVHKYLTLVQWFRCKMRRWVFLFRTSLRQIHNAVYTNQMQNAAENIRCFSNYQIDVVQPWMWTIYSYWCMERPFQRRLSLICALLCMFSGLMMPVIFSLKIRQVTDLLRDLKNITSWLWCNCQVFKFMRMGCSSSEGASPCLDGAAD